MNRRDSIEKVFGRKKISTKSKVSAPLFASPALSSLSLDPYAGPFDFQTAGHLLRRVSFGATVDQVKQAVTDGLDGTLDKIFEDIGLPAPPVNPYYPDDPNVPIGETWIDQPFTADDMVREYRVNAVIGWQAGLQMTNSINILEKMTLFWHNHFAVTDEEEPRYIYNYSNMLRSNALGNFQTFVEEVTINPAMLIFLNGNNNFKQSPNENYARELFELFTIGKGPLAGPGDYTFYTEDDIQAAAKVLTGWNNIGYFAWDDTQPGAEFIAIGHDNTTKLFSPRFGNESIPASGDQEYKALINLILQQDETAKFIVRKLYRWFVNFEITADIEWSIIEPLAAQFRIDYEIKPIIRTLINSQHFFSDEALGCVIKNPMDFAFAMMNQFEVKFSEDLAARYEQHQSVGQFAGFTQMSYFAPPNVAGWKAYYQEPAYYQVWLNSVTLPQRIGYAYVAALFGFDINGAKIEIDPLKAVDKLDAPSDVNAMIEQLAAFIFPKPLTTTQKIYLKGVLIPGLPDFEWEVEYLDYTADPTNEAVAAPVRNKLKNLLSIIMTMAEYQLM